MATTNCCNPHAPGGTGAKPNFNFTDETLTTLSGNGFCRRICASYRRKAWEAFTAAAHAHHEGRSLAAHRFARAMPAAASACPMPRMLTGPASRPGGPAGTRWLAMQHGGQIVYGSGWRRSLARSRAGGQRGHLHRPADRRARIPRIAGAHDRARQSRPDEGKFAALAGALAPERRCAVCARKA